jgi:hypothetical protein
MSDPKNDEPADVPLNPALKSSRETTYDTRRTTPTPFDTASAKEGEGEGWPVIWLVVIVICLVLAIYFIV